MLNLIPRPLVSPSPFGEGFGVRWRRGACRGEATGWRGIVADGRAVVHRRLGCRGESVF
jgi:hypothetical protein